MSVGMHKSATYADWPASYFELCRCSALCLEQKERSIVFGPDSPYNIGRDTAHL